MDSTFPRTSVTVDEAVGILLGLIKGPVEYKPFEDDDSQEGQDYLDGLSYSLQDYLDEEEEELTSDLAEAKADQLSSAVIKEKHDAVQKHADVRRLAKTYLCAIKDELLKSEPALRVDRTLSSDYLTYITLTSLNEWAVTKAAGVQVLAPLPELIPSKMEKTEDKKAPKVRQKQRDQEEAIVEEIRRLGFNPLECPEWRRDSKGVKANVWETLEGTELFATRGVFEKAWQRARDHGDIAEKK